MGIELLGSARTAGRMLELVESVVGPRCRQSGAPVNRYDKRLFACLSQKRHIALSTSYYVYVRWFVFPVAELFGLCNVYYAS